MSAVLIPNIGGAEVALMDVDPERYEPSGIVGRSTVRIVADQPAGSAITDHRAAVGRRIVAIGEVEWRVRPRDRSDIQGVAQLLLSAVRLGG